MKIIIVGCGRWGAGLAQTLSERAHEITVVDSDPAAFERLGPRFDGQIVTGVGFDREVLLQAGVERADGLAAVTPSDEANLVVARIGRQIFHIPKVIARLYDSRKAEIYRPLGIQTISTVDWGVHRIAELLCYSGLKVTTSLGHGGVDIVEMEVPVFLLGRTVSELAIPDEVQVIALSRAGKTFLPTTGTVFVSGDLIHIVLLSGSADRLQAVVGAR
jgi:trk system potassium uptake protein TrkA